MWFLQIVRSFFFTLDSTLFNFIPQVYDLLIAISRTSILTQGQIKQFADRIQLFLGVFMLFKVTFSLITYIVMPDEFSDKSKGFGKLWQNIIISLVLLILTPYAFNMAYEFQAMILEDNTLAVLVFGDSGDNENYISTAGEKISYTIMEPMFSPNVSVGDLFECSSMVVTNESGVRKFNENCKAILLDYYQNGDSDNKSANNIFVNNYAAGVEHSNLGLFFRLEMAKATVAGNKNGGNEAFLIDYNIPVTTVVAVIVLLLLVTFCMDVALRSIKLSFLQLISPIPIIGYIDPKGKDGIFKKWYQMCFSTYLSLFVRLLALYLGIYIISKVNSMTDIITGASVTNGFVKIFIIVGVLMFAKQLPKILEGLGIKLDGDGKFTLNPFKKFEDEALGGKQIVGGAKGLAGAGLAGVSAMGANWMNGLNNIRNAVGFKDKAKAFGMGALSGAAGFASASGRGLVGTVQGKKFKDVYSGSYSGAINERNARTERRANGVKWYEPIGTGFQKTVGMTTAGATVKSVNDDFKSFQSAYESIKNIAVSSDTRTKELNNRLEAMNKTSINASDYVDSTTGVFDRTGYQSAVDAHEATKKAISDQIDARINRFAAGQSIMTNGRINSGANAAIQDALKTMDTLQTRINEMAPKIDVDFTPISGYDVTSRYKSSKGSQSQFSISSEASHAEKVDQYSKGIGPIANSNKK